MAFVMKKKGPWTPEEDMLLTKYIQSHGVGQWRTLPQKAGLQRCGKGCRSRWMNYLSPNVKRGNICLEEEDLILRLHKLLGNRWSLIAGRVPGRTDNEIKNYWNTKLRKKIQAVKTTINENTNKLSYQPIANTPPNQVYQDQKIVTNFYNDMINDNKTQVPRTQNASFIECNTARSMGMMENINMMSMNPQEGLYPTNMIQNPFTNNLNMMNMNPEEGLHPTNMIQNPSRNNLNMVNENSMPYDALMMEHMRLRILQNSLMFGLDNENINKLDQSMVLQKQPQQQGGGIYEGLLGNVVTSFPIYEPPYTEIQQGPDSFQQQGLGQSSVVDENHEV